MTNTTELSQHLRNRAENNPAPVMSVTNEEMLALLDELDKRDAQIAELTAESVAMKSAITNTVRLLNELKTPATDAAANALRAEGINAALGAVDGMDADCVQDATDRDRDYCDAFVDGMMSVYGQISQYARELLREGK